MAAWLGIKTPCVDSACWDFDGDAVNMIIQMCQAVNADQYLSNEGAEDYIDTCREMRMWESGIHHEWLDWKDPDEKPLSAIHHLFTLGPEAARLVQP